MGNIFQPADILLPRDGSLEKWAVIACDQFTSDGAYWERVRAFAGDGAEVFLSTADREPYLAP